MNKSYKKWIWGGLGWALIGPIGGILGYALGSLSQDTGHSGSNQTRGGDFLISLFSICTIPSAVSISKTASFSDKMVPIIFVPSSILKVCTL